MDLVEHADHVDAELTMIGVQAEFARSRRRFLGVVKRGLFVGVAAGQRVTELLSLQYGHALFGRAPIGQHVMRDALVVTPATPLTDLLKLVAARGEEAFSHDIALVSERGEFVGLIPMHRLVRLQTRLLIENLAEVEEQRRELAERNLRMEDDLRMAREVQLALLPSRPVRVQHSGRAIETQHFYQPADVIGGDLFAVFSPGPAQLACCVCDVMGHGVRPALVTAILRALVQASHPAAADPGAMLTDLNRALQEVLHSVGELIFVTAGYAVIDLERGELRYAQAGHPPPMFWQTASQDAALLRLAADSAGPALGLLDDLTFATTMCAFCPGDALLLYTDGLVEVATPDGLEFGVERLRACFAEAMTQARIDAAATMVETALAFGGNRVFSDDVCLLMVRCTGAELQPS